ncbi:MAG TPA: hypothetical protein VG293_08290 [Solirubrobacteraceae bacterium]|nr:hypothetical protein [Solirubrobacteraceae bacterium]
MRLRPRVAHSELDAALTRLLLSAYEHAQARRVDELDATEVHNDG